MCDRGDSIKEGESMANPRVLSTCPLHTDSGCGKERLILVGPW